MAQEYLPAPSNVRLADLMKEHNISQPELAKEIGCSKSTISRFISGAKGTLTHEQVLKIARLFNVSTDFLLGETNIPDRKNYDIAELGLSVEPFFKLPAQLHTRGLLDVGVGVHQHIRRGVPCGALNGFHIAAGDHQLIGGTGMPQTVEHNAGEFRVGILPFEELLADQHRLHCQTIG